ncbi:MAG TPA: TetR/AcrR family transcriptional regulator [Acidimicrobiales bacterium]|nr:TetR/AcrR family transcriptional regulator [Acidimicrobiales bacterium]
MTDTSAACDASDPRIVRSRAAVLEATVELLGEVGHSGTTIEAIAERSGVAKTTIYRHWPRRAPLLVDALYSRVEHAAFEPTGDLRADLLALVGGLARKLRDPNWSRMVATLLDAAESDPEIAELSAAFTQQRRELCRSVLDRGVQAGELRADADTDTAAQLLGGAVFYKRLILRRPATDADLEVVVDLILDGLRTR